jgi:L-histidine Nalpha-methyltransferase
MLIETPASDSISALAADVRAGLTKAGQKELPSKYLYDTLGSKLFEAICDLPEYGLTRADERLLRTHSPELAARIPGELIVCELGSGSGRKTRWVLEALSQGRHISYFPIEISAAALAVCQRELADISSVGIVGLEREYLDGLLEVAARRQPGQRILVLFLGSTIGNFSHPADQRFLCEIRRILAKQDLLLLGTDLFETADKPVSQLLTAYDDPAGVTAAFNLNLLGRLNRELGADFRLDRFKHFSKLNRETQSIEMHLRSTQRQTVHIPAADLVVEFAMGESIWTENSHKYLLREVNELAETAGFSCDRQWVDREWPFAETLLVAE